MRVFLCEKEFTLFNSYLSSAGSQFHIAASAVEMVRMIILSLPSQWGTVDCTVTSGRVTVMMVMTMV